MTGVVIHLEAYRRAIEAQTLTPGTLRWERAMRELDRMIGPVDDGRAKS
jgi:hypothetical protein